MFKPYFTVFLRRYRNRRVDRGHHVCSVQRFDLRNRRKRVAY